MSKRKGNRESKKQKKQPDGTKKQKKDPKRYDEPSRSSTKESPAENFDES